MCRGRIAVIRAGGSQYGVDLGFRYRAARNIHNRPHQITDHFVEESIPPEFDSPDMGVVTWLNESSGNSLNGIDGAHGGFDGSAMALETGEIMGAGKLLKEAIHAGQVKIRFHAPCVPGDKGVNIAIGCEGVYIPF